MDRDFQAGHALNASKVARDIQGIDQCLNRLGDLVGMARNLDETLRIMDSKLHGARPSPQTSGVLTPSSKSLSNTEEMNEKLSNLSFLLNEMRESILQINNFINAEIG